MVQLNFWTQWGFDTAKQSKWTQHEVFIVETAFQPIVWGNWVGKFFIDVVKTTSLITGTGSGEEMSGCTLERLKSRFPVSSLNSSWPREEGLSRITHQLQGLLLNGCSLPALNTSEWNASSNVTQNDNNTHLKNSSYCNASHGYQVPDPLHTLFFFHSVFTKTHRDCYYHLYFLDEDMDQRDSAVCPRSHS